MRFPSSAPAWSGAAPQRFARASLVRCLLRRYWIGVLEWAHDRRTENGVRAAQGATSDDKRSTFDEEPPFLGPADVHARWRSGGSGRADGDHEPALTRDADR